MRLLGETGLPDNPVLIAPRKTLTLEGFSADRAARRSAWENLWTSTDRLQSLRDNSNAEGRAMEEARQNRRKAILDATGEDIAKVSHEEFRTLMRSSDPNATVEDITAKEYQRRLNDLAARYPDKLDAIRPAVSLEQDAFALAQGAEADAAAARTAADASGLRGPSKLGAALGGGFQGALRDPVQVGTLLVGGGASTARTVFGRIVETMLTEAIINGGVEAAVQVSANDWKRRAGLDASLGTSLEQVGLATLFGGAFGGLLEGGRAAVKALGADVAPDVLERAVAGDAGAVREVAAAMGQKVDAPTESLLARAVEEDGLDAPFVGAELSRDEQRLRRAALDHANDPDGFFAPDIAERALSDPARTVPSTLNTLEYERLYDMEPFSGERQLAGHYSIQRTADPREGLSLAPGARLEPHDAEALLEAERYAGEIADPAVDSDGNVVSMFDYIKVEDGDGNFVNMTAREALDATDEDIFLADVLDACKS